MSNLNKKLSKKLSGEENINIVGNKRFTTADIKNMESKGIVHVTEAVGINAIRDAATDFVNFFGKSGFESKLYDKAKQKAFMKLKKLVNNKKYYVGNIKTDIETTQTTIFCHLIGTIYKPIKEE